MLTAETKRHIDAARQVLVGVVPNPASQIDQITNALVYKFMDDMDQAALKAGGEPSFFVGDLDRYSWSRLMDPRIGNQERMNLYVEALQKFSQAKSLPELFRDIFKSAFLPYRSPETLGLFLREISYFDYAHSEELGNAYEYLLSVMASQGDAGQFRTPRHIIDFIVGIVDPKKDETVLDPACGTAGFLISAYKHILAQHDGKDGPEKKEKPLTPDERKKLLGNLQGYDIDPGMIRLAQVNMYLHQFKNPKIFGYDTLTQDERWGDKFDVILANPPFMSPKGGIKPHSKFSIQAKRSEVLFVDYIAEHLKPNGRAGIIVPEGIIFQSQTAYTELRKMLVDTCLIAVISLPAGCFNPYSGVKTSILILDKSLARQAQTIAFFKVENDGFSLGAQRRPIEKNDLPQVQSELAAYLEALRAKASTDTLALTTGLIVPKEKIAANGDYNLSGERHREGPASNSSFPMVELGEVCELVRGVVFSKEDEVSEGGVQVLRANNIDKARYELNLDDIKRVSPKVDFSDEKKMRKDDILICLASGSKDHIGKVALIENDTDYFFGGFMGVIRVKRDRLHPSYLLKQLTTGRFNDFLREQIAGANINNLSGGLLYRFQIPLPPLEVQKEIVAEIEGYQKVISGARAILDNYRPHISIHPDWPIELFGEVTSTITPPAKIQAGNFSQVGRYPVIDQSQEAVAGRTDDETTLVDGANGLVIFGDHTCVVKFVDEPFAQGADGIKIIKAGERLDPRFVYFYLLSHPVEQDGYRRHFGKLRESRIAIPPLAVQQALVAEIEAEQALVAANRELVTRFEKKIQDVLSRVWGGVETVPNKEG